MPVLKNILRLYACAPAGGQGDVHEIENAALAWQGEKIVWVGREADLPAIYGKEPVVNGRGLLAVPGLIDCHTHLAFGGWRDAEFQLRIQGKSYLDIQAAGGGIFSTMRQTRAAGKKELLDKCGGLLAAIQKLGVTTLEAKSGYGLDRESELKILEIYRELSQKQPLEIIPTFLGAHVMPPEFEKDRPGYLTLLIEKLLPEISKRQLARFCDVFVEDKAFTKDEARAVLNAARKLGLKAKLHVDQLSDGSGAALAAELSAVSADHLEYISDAGITALKKSGTVAVMLPIATLYTFQKPLDARRLVTAGIPVAVATDFNPGSAPNYNLHEAMNLACLLNRLTPAEVLKGATLHAAQALNLESTHGSLEVGKQADVALIDAPCVDFWLYHPHGNRCQMTVKAGREIYVHGR